jgi:hypothetical protein
MDVLTSTAASLRDPRGNEPDRLARGIQRWLSPPDPSTNHDYVWKAHHTGTSSWFFESDALTKWKKTGSFLWIHGKRMIFNLSVSAAHIDD